MATALWDRGIWVIAGLAIGGAAEDAIRPILEPAAQNAWARRPYRVLSAGEAAQLRAREQTNAIAGIDLGVIDPVDDARRQGIGAQRFALQTELARTWPGVAMLLDLRRRNIAFGGSSGIDRPTFRNSLRRQGYTADTVDNLSDLLVEHLTPQQVALGMVRSIIDDQGLQVGANDTSGGVVPAYPVSPIDGEAEAASFGFDKERLRIMLGEIGLPMSLQQAASAYFRNIIELPDFYKAVAQGDTRPAWGPFILDQARQILSANQYAELQLRGFLTEAQRRTRTAQWGMSDANSDLLYDLLGRSIPVHQIETGTARGGVYNGSAADIPEAYLSSLRRGNLRPEFYNLAYANRYTMPSPFEVRALLTAGAIDAAEGESLYLKMGREPALAKQVAEHFAGTPTATKHPLVTKAETQLWTTTHRSYLSGEADQAEATNALTVLHADPAVIPEIFTLWDTEKALVRKTLSPAQIKKAFAEPATNAATGQPWTRDEAIAALVDLGYSVVGANDYLNL